MDFKLQSQITFLYFKDLTPAANFFEAVLRLEKCEDQGFAKIYRIAHKAFVGIVDEAKGFCDAQDTSAVLITLVVENVHGWYDYLKDRREVRLLSEVQRPLAPVECFFFEGPGGYRFEIQRFLEPETANRFA
jgi:hypothetical protein